MTTTTAATGVQQRWRVYSWGGGQVRMTWGLYDAQEVANDVKEFLDIEMMIFVDLGGRLRGALEERLEYGVEPEEPPGSKTRSRESEDASPACQECEASLYRMLGDLSSIPAADFLAGLLDFYTPDALNRIAHQAWSWLPPSQTLRDIHPGSDDDDSDDLSKLAGHPSSDGEAASGGAPFEMELA